MEHVLNRTPGIPCGVETLFCSPHPVRYPNPFMAVDNVKSLISVFIQCYNT